jgi:hypothetical protein
VSFFDYSRLELAVTHTITANRGGAITIKSMTEQSIPFTEYLLQQV